MITLSEQDKFIIEQIVDFIAHNPTKEQTNKKLIVAFCEHIMNLTYPSVEPQGQINVCRITRTLTFPFQDRQTKERVFLCLKCRSLHSPQQTQVIKEILDDESPSNPTGTRLPTDKDS